MYVHFQHLHIVFVNTCFQTEAPGTGDNTKALLAKRNHGIVKIKNDIVQYLLVFSFNSYLLLPVLHHKLCILCSPIKKFTNVRTSECGGYSNNRLTIFLGSCTSSAHFAKYHLQNRTLQAGPSSFRT